MPGSTTTSGRLQDKVSIVTGGGSGIGAATAKLWAREGAKVVVVDIHEEHGAKVVREIVAAGGHAFLVSANVSLAADAERMVEQTIEVYGRLDILYNNAGILGERKKVTEMNEEEIDKVISVNLKGAVLGAKFAIPAMIRTAGSGVVLNTGSDTAFQGNRGMPVYSATKGALLAFTRAVAMDHVEENIRCNMVSPCVSKTAMTDSIRLEQPAVWREVLQTVPMGRACEAEDVAKAALFLVSDDASFITGENLMVDGGTIAKGV